MNNLAQRDAELELIDEMGKYANDFSGFIMVAWQWGEKDTELEHFEGPEDWVKDVARDIDRQVRKNAFNGVDPVMCVKVAIASGNGCAKSAFLAMVNCWIMSTRPLCRVTVTANTEAQLSTKTWPEFEKWMRMCITGHWFEISATTIQHKQHGRKWATNALTWSLKNPKAFAGQHQRVSSSVYLWDESSHIPELIMGEADGGINDGEPFWIMTGNPNNRGGRLFRAVFGDLKYQGPKPPAGKYISRSIDSRTCRFTNKQQIQEWIDERGEDSDWVRAHVKGLAPNADETQYVALDRVQQARKRPLPGGDNIEPLVMSIDFARGGSAFNVVGYRRGRDTRSIPRRRIAGDKTRDTTAMVSMIGEEINSRRPDIIFGDATGIGGPIMDRLRQLHKGIPIVDVVNGGTAPDDGLNNQKSRYGNWRAYCWGKMNEWLVTGCIEDDDKLENDLTGPGFWHDSHDRLMLESKDDMLIRGLASPDDGDQLAMTFAKPITMDMIQRIHRTPAKKTPVRPSRPIGRGRNWMRT